MPIKKSAASLFAVVLLTVYVVANREDWLPSMSKLWRDTSASTISNIALVEEASWRRASLHDSQHVTANTRLLLGASSMRSWSPARVVARDLMPG